MSKGRKKIRHRKTINGGAGEDGGQQKSQETSQEKYERMKLELLNYNKNEYQPLIDIIETLYKTYEHKVKHLEQLYMSFLAKKKILEEEQSPLSDNEKEQLREIIREYFESKEKMLQFKKNCKSSKLFISDCKTKVIERIKEFLTRLYHLLQKNENRESKVEQSIVSKDGLTDFFKEIYRLKKLESCQEFSDLTSKNVESLVGYVSELKLPDEDKNLVSTIETLFPQNRSIELDDSQQQYISAAKQQAAEDTQNSTSNTKLPDVIDELVSKIKKQGRRDILDKVTLVMQRYINGNITYDVLLISLNGYLDELSQDGGSQSVRRNKRKTKKQNKNKNKYKRSKKHHHRTKRHMKRHMKTKRHMKRHRKTKRHTKRY